MQRVGFIVYPGFQIIGLAAATAFEIANLVNGEPVYEVSVRSETGETIPGSDAVSVSSAILNDTHFDTLILLGGTDLPRPSHGLLAYVREAHGTVRRLASICTGAFILAEAGLLDGRRATTHWLLAPELKTRFPAIKVEEDRIFLIDGTIWTSAGMSAGIDLALAMIEKDLGREIARSVAQKLVLYHRRAGGQSQHSTLLQLEPKSDRIQTALDYARRNLKKTLSVEKLAEAARLSPRQFSRIFRAETGQSPAKAVEQLRIEAARLMLEQGRHPVDVIARETGFDDRNRMRRAFLRAYGLPPQDIKRRLAET
ncbi:GlxA family transcriptional regulator [Gluconacetobacter tumulicola]|uniref:GlxA family transcriptional regulator n=1 Tax=Gluconacetobacter tumulicola TaxID=1017177 RepID=A0A7W4P827_9PROT|nr:GlxA family transcriptional regulator [Gluconacetobacter tumulicola]MBB2181016.1 GlxA family transcriptional regulator [Gluconacetobacter tumulicola]